MDKWRYHVISQQDPKRMYTCSTLCGCHRGGPQSVPCAIEDQGSDWLQPGISDRVDQFFSTAQGSRCASYCLSGAGTINLLYWMPKINSALFASLKDNQHGCSPKLSLLSSPGRLRAAVCPTRPNLERGHSWYLPSFPFYYPTPVALILLN